MASILILEDDFVLANDFQTALSACGHEVTLVGTATEAMVVCQTKPIDLAIVDIFIKRKDSSFIPDGGLSLISKLRLTRGLPTSARVPIIAISGGASVEGSHDPLAAAKATGATTTIAKPIDLLTLVDVVEGCLAPSTS